MEYQEILKKALIVREKYASFEKQKYGKEWTREQLIQGFVGDVGDLIKISMAKEGYRQIDDVDNKLAHELSDCLWSILVLSDKYQIDLEKAFIKSMDELMIKIENKK